MLEGSPRPVEYRVQEFLADKDMPADFPEKYMLLILDEWRTLGKEMKRSTMVQVGLALAFILIAARSIQEFSIAGWKVGNLAVVSALIPPAVSGLLLREVLLNLRRRLISSILYELIRQKFPSLYSSDLDEPLYPTALAVTTVERTNLLTGTELNKFLAVMEIIETFFFMLILPLAFGVYAYIQLSSSPSIGDIWFYLSLATAVSLLILAEVLYALSIVRIKFD